MYVKIKTWEQMEKEFGLDENGSIDCPYIFTKEMENLIPEDRVIEIYDEMWHTYDPKDCFSISDDMIEKVLNPEKDSMYFI